MGRLNLSASNPVKDGIDAFTALSANYRADDATKLAEAKDAREATAADLQNQVAQTHLTTFNNQQTDNQLGEIRQRISAGLPLSADQKALVSQNANVDQGEIVSAIPVSMPVRNTTIQSAKDITSSMSPDEADTAMGPQQNQALADRKKILVEGLSNVAQGGIPTLDQFKAMSKEVVNNPAISDHDLGGQYKNIVDVQGMESEIAKLTQPTKITDPNIMSKFSAAYPTIAKNSNLQGAAISSIYVTPSPDGDPAKAQFIIGLTGQNDAGDVVDGVMTVNRSSHPGDAVVRLTGGELSTQLQQKKLLLDGLKAAQVHYGNKDVMAIYEKDQATRKLSDTMLELAASMPPGLAQKEMNSTGRLLRTDGVTLEQATTVMTKLYDPQNRAEAAAVAHASALQLKTMDKETQLAVGAANNEATIKGHQIQAEATIKAAELHEAGRKDSENKTTIRANSAQAIELSKEISAQETRLYPITTSTDNMMDPLHPIVKTVMPTAEAIPGIKANIEAKKKEYARLTGQAYVAPSAPAPVVTTPGDVAARADAYLKSLHPKK